MKFKSLLVVVLVAMLALAAFPIAAQGPAREDTVIFDLDRNFPDPTQWNPYTPSGVSTTRLVGGHQAMWEPLFVLNRESGEINPWLGLSFESNEAFDVWTLALREGVTWSDGEVFDADDVMFTVEMLLADETASLYNAGDMQKWVAGVEKVDAYTVVFTLTDANPRFLLDYFSIRINDSLLILPEHIWAGQDPLTFTFYDEEMGWPIGTGPYTLTSAESDRIVWDRNDAWWGAEAGFMDLPEPLRLVWLTSGTEENLAQLITNNEIDAGQNVTVGAFEAIQARNPNVIAWFDGFPYSYPAVCTRQLDFNTTVAPWDNTNMRKAISLLIDREQIVQIAYEGTTQAARTMFVEYGGMQPYIGAVIEAGYGLSPNADVEAAKALIEAEGYVLNSDGIYEKDGESLIADITVNNASTEYTRTIDVIVEQLISAGIDAVARPVDNATFWGSAAPTGDYTIAYSWLSCGSVNEPWASMSRYTNANIVPLGEHGGFNNTGRWDTEATTAYTAIIDQMSVMPLGDPAVAEMVVEAYAYLDAEMPFVPLVQSTKLLPFNTTYWTGWPTAEDNYNAPAFWPGSTHVIIHNLTKAE